MNLVNLAKQITGNGTDEAKSVSVTPSKEAVVAIIAKTADAVADGGIPDALNRWKGMTPEELSANEKAREKMTKKSDKIGPKERKLAADRAKQANEPGAVGGLTEADKAAAAALKKEKAAKAKEQAEKKLAALKEKKAEAKRVKDAAKAATKGGDKAILAHNKAVDAERKPDLITRDDMIRANETGKPLKATGFVSKDVTDISMAEMNMDEPKAVRISVRAQPKKAAKAKPEKKAGDGRPDGLKPGSKLAKLLDAAMAAGEKGATEAQLCQKLGGWKKCAVTLRRVCERVGAKVHRDKDGRFVVTL